MNLTITNFKGLEGTFSFHLKPGINLVTGNNTAGKSTVINAFAHLFGGGKSNMGEEIISQGKTECSIEFDHEGLKTIVHYTKKADGSVKREFFCSLNGIEIKAKELADYVNPVVTLSDPYDIASKAATGKTGQTKLLNLILAATGWDVEEHEAKISAAKAEEKLSAPAVVYPRPSGEPPANYESFDLLAESKNLSEKIKSEPELDKLLKLINEFIRAYDWYKYSLSQAKEKVFVNNALVALEKEKEEAIYALNNKIGDYDFEIKKTVYLKKEEPLLYFKKVPFSEASKAESIEAVLLFIIALPAFLKLICFSDGDCFDIHFSSAIAQKIRDNGYYALVECVHANNWSHLSDMNIFHLDKNNK